MANEFKVKNGLVVSGSADIEQDLRVRGTLTVDELHTSITTSSIIYESGSTKFGDDLVDTHDFTGSVSITGSISLNGEPIGTGKLNETTFESFTASYTTGSFTGSFIGDGSGLTNVPASGVIGLNLSQIATGSITASVSTDGFNVNTSTSITGSLNVSGEILSQTTPLVSSSSQIQITGTTGYSTFSSSIATTNFNQEIQLNSLETSTSSLNNFSASALSRLTNIETSTSSLNTFTSSIDTTIKNKLNSDSVVSGSVQIDITQTTNYTSFSSSIATTDLNQTNRLISIETSTGSLNSYTSSTNTRLNSLESASGSIRTDFNSFTSSYITVSSSLDSRLDVLEAYSGSQQVPTASYSFRTSQTDVYCKNVTGVQINKGTVVRIIGATGDSPLISPAHPTSEENSANTLGIATQDIPNDSFGLIITEGILLGVNTDGMTAGALLYLGSNGTFTTTKPTPPNHGVRLGEVLRVQQNNGSIYVRIDNGMELDEAHDVIYTNISNGDLLVRSGSVWHNSKNLTGSYYITGSLNASGILHGSNITAIETSTGSLNSFTSSINTTIKNKLNADGVISGSIQVDVTQTTGYNTFSSSISSSIGALSSSVAITTNGLSSSVATYNLGQDGRLSSLEGKTGSYATTGSNIFVGNQTITGSVTITENLLVYGSSSITYVTASQLAVSTSFISVNVFEPAERFGGLKVFDSGSSAATASLAWDSQNNRWVYQNASGSSYSGGMLISGPRNTGSLGDEPSLTSGKIPKSVGGDHIDNSIMNETAGVIYVTGSVSATGTIYGTNIIAIESTTSSLNSYTASNDSTNTTQNNRLISLETSTSSLNSYTSSTNTRLGVIESTTASLNTFTSSTNTRLGLIETSTGSLNSYTSSNNIRLGVIETATSSLNSFTSSTNTRLGLIETSTGSLNSFTNSINTTIKNKLNTDGVISGSAQVIAALPSGTVSGSSQILAGTTIHSGSFFNGIAVVSGSGQISFGGITGVPSGLVSGSSQISFGGITGVPSGLVSGSSQISFGSISGVPSGLVSGSSQISFGSISGVPSGLVSGSSQVLNGTTIHSGSFFNGITVVSGSAQISFSGISGVPSGLVSGSSQITLSSTSGFGSYLNQAVLTSSSPSFAGLTTTGLLTMSRSAGSTGLDMATNDNYASMRVIANQVTSGVNSDGMYIGYQNGNSGITRIFGGGASSGGIIVNGSGVNNVTIAGNIVLNAGNYTSYAVAGAGYSANQNLNTTSNVTFSTIEATTGFYHNTSSTRSKYSVYGSTGNPYVIGMQSGIQYGGLADWGMTFQFNNDSGRGFWWGDDGHNTSQGAMALTTDGRLTVARNIRVGYGEADTTTPTLPLQVYGSGGTVLDIQGSAGQLFSVTDDLTGDIFSISDISGVPMINVNTTNGTSFGSTIFPSANNAYDLGTSSYRWANVYTNDLHLSNEGKSGGNDIDGTTGNWTIQEGAEQLYIINNKNGKKYKINLTEVE